MAATYCGLASANAGDTMRASCWRNASSGSLGREAIWASISGGRRMPWALPGVVQPSTTAPTRLGHEMASRWAMRPPIDTP